MAKKKNGSTVRKVILSLVAVLLGLVFVLMLGVTVWAEYMLNKINRPEDTLPTLSAEEIQSIQEATDPIDEDYTGIVLDPEEVELATVPPEEVLEEEHIINIMLIGQDRRENQGRQRSDSMILCTVNTEKKTLVMTSFLRDLYVDIPDWNGESYLDNRLNVNYVFGGMEMLDACLELNFGVKIDHNVEVDFSGFKSIIDKIGGVDIELTAAEAGYIGGLSSGMNHLNGEQALTYARIRYLDSDFVRTSRQRTVIMAVLEKVRHMSLTEINGLINDIFPMLTTDMDNSDIAGYVLEIFPILTELTVTTQHIPAEGTYYGARIREMAVLVPDLEANRQILRETIGLSE